MYENLKSITVNDNTIINLTMHDITYISGEEKIVFPGNKDAVVRIEQDYVPVGNPFGLKLEKKTANKKVSGLPNQKEGVFYIVSGLIRNELPGRTDLLAPSQNVKNQIKNDAGHTIAVLAFETNLC